MVNRLFGVSRSIKFGLYAYTTFMFGGMIITSSMFPAVCEPRKKFWNPMMPGDCWPTKNVLAISYLNGGVIYPEHLESLGLAKLFSSNFCAQRLYPCGIACYVHVEIADADKKKGRAWHTHGTWDFVSHDFAFPVSLKH